MKPAEYDPDQGTLSLMAPKTNPAADHSAAGLLHTSAAA
jgi:hypothetical protein